MDHIGIDLHKRESQICILAEGGELIERRIRTDPRPPYCSSSCAPVKYIVFDLLELGGEDLRAQPLQERREALEELTADRQLVMPTRRLPANGLEAWAEVLRGNYEGMVAKDPASAYMPGRTLLWLKVKQRGYRQEARGFDQR
jgi:ATP-dependent DNA ligase